MAYDVSSAQLLEEMGNRDWSGIIGDRDATVQGGTPLKQIAAPLAGRGLVVVPVAPEGMRHDSSKAPVAFVVGKQVTYVQEEGDKLALEGKRGGLSAAVRTVLGDMEMGAPDREVHETLDRKGGDMRLQDLVGVDARGKATGLRMIITESPRALVVYDARGSGDVSCSLEDGDNCPLRRLRVMVFSHKGLLVTCGNMDGKGETVTIDSVSSVSQVTRRVEEIVGGVDVAKANEAQKEWDANTVRVGWISMHFDVRTALEILGGGLFLLAIFGYTFLNHMETKPEWLDFLLNSNGAAAVAVVVVLAVYVAFSGMMRDKGDK